MISLWAKNNYIFYESRKIFDSRYRSTLERESCESPPLRIAYLQGFTSKSDGPASDNHNISLSEKLALENIVE